MKRLSKFSLKKCKLVSNNLLFESFKMIMSQIIKYQVENPNVKNPPKY